MGGKDVSLCAPFFRLHLEMNINLETTRRWVIGRGAGSGIGVIWRDFCLVKRILGLAELAQKQLSSSWKKKQIVLGFSQRPAL